MNETVESVVRRIAELESRQQILERDLARARRLGMRLRFALVGAVGIAAIVAIVPGGAVKAGDDDRAHDEIKARKLSIVDGDGKARAVLEHEKGSTALTILDKGGTKRVVLDDKGWITIFDPVGVRRASFGDLGYYLYGEDGKQRVGISMSSNSAALAFEGPDGELRAFLGESPDHAGSLLLMDKDGKQSTFKAPEKK
jgi:hypothetical protein